MVKPHREWSGFFTSFNSGYRIIRCYNTAIELYAYESVHHIKTVKDFLR